MPEPKLVPVTPALQELQAWIAENSSLRTQSAIGHACGVKQPSVRGWLIRTSRPSHDTRIVLERVTCGRVRAVDWLTDDEKALLDGADDAAEKLGGSDLADNSNEPPAENGDAA